VEGLAVSAFRIPPVKHPDTRTRGPLAPAGKALNPPSCRQTSSLFRESTRIEPTVKAYQLPRKSGE
jgi:hypothetical protein